MDQKNGRYAILWPHGILFRDAEADMRRHMVETDQIEAVIGLGPNLFYNSPMEAMILVGNTNKSKERKGKVLFVNGKDDYIENKGQAYLTEAHIIKLYKAFKDFVDIPHYAKVATIDEIMALDGNMNIKFYVNADNAGDEVGFGDAFTAWETSGRDLKDSMKNLLEALS